MPSPDQLWTIAERNRLCDMVSEGLTFAKIAERMGRSRNSVIGHFSRIRYSYGEQAA